MAEDYFSLEVWNGRVAVSKQVDLGEGCFVYMAADNWETLEEDALRAVRQQGGTRRVSGHYFCPDELAGRGRWTRLPLPMPPLGAGLQTYRYVDS